MNLSVALAFALPPPGNLSGALILFFALLIGHSLGDFALQSEFVSKHKGRSICAEREPADNGFPPNLWVYCLTAHSLVHAGFVWIIIGSPLWGLVEFVAHWLTDFAKGENWFGFQTDQLIHVLTKAVYVVILWFQVST